MTILAIFLSMMKYATKEIEVGEYFGVTKLPIVKAAAAPAGAAVSVTSTQWVFGKVRHDTVLPYAHVPGVTGSAKSLDVLMSILSLTAIPVLSMDRDKTVFVAYVRGVKVVDVSEMLEEAGVETVMVVSMEGIWMVSIAAKAGFVRSADLLNDVIIR